MSECSCGSAKKKTILLFACSGGANVAEVSDRAARELMFSGKGQMFCLAGLGAGIPDMVQKAKDTDLNVVNRLTQVEWWVRTITGVVFVLAGISYCLAHIYGISLKPQ